MIVWGPHTYFQQRRVDVVTVSCDTLYFVILNAPDGLSPFLTVTKDSKELIISSMRRAR